MSDFPTKENPQPCKNGCGTRIYLSDKKLRGKWLQYELDGEYHECPNYKQDAAAVLHSKPKQQEQQQLAEDDAGFMQERFANFEKLLDLSGINLKLTQTEISSIVKGGAKDLVRLMLEMQKAMIAMDKWSAEHEEQDKAKAANNNNRQQQEGLN